MSGEDTTVTRSGVEAIVLSTADEENTESSSKELWPKKKPFIQQPDERQLRKTQSAHDISAELEDNKLISDAKRRMSISAAPPFSADSSETHNSSRRSSVSSIIISLSRPDSPIPQILQQPDTYFDSDSVEFLKLRKTVTAVQSVGRFSKNKLHPSINESEEERDSQKSGKTSRRSSSPPIPKLDLSNEESKWSKVDDVRRRRGRRSSVGSDIQAFCRPASRPSSAVAGIASRPSSSATIVQLGKLSRPWTPAGSPGSPCSPSSSQQQLWSSNGRPNFRNRSPGAISAPLQALNHKVNNILSSAGNILDFYQLRPDLKKDVDPLRKARLEKSKRMNEMNNQKVDVTGALAKLEKLRNLPVGPAEKDRDITVNVTKLPPLVLPTLPPLLSKKKLPAHGKVNSLLSKKKAEVKQKKDDLKANKKVEEEVAKSKGKSKGIALLKSLIANRTPAAAAAAFVGKKTLPLPAKARMSKVLRIRRQFGRPATRNKNQNSQNSQNNQNTGPPTLVNFFKRSKPSDRSQPIKYETYTDKDRAAAVLLGDADIKTTLEKQLKSERGRYVLPKESPAQVYLAQADFEMRIGGLATAKGLLNKALELQPGDKHALVCRSRCRLQMGDMAGALADAEEALNKDANYVKATYQKAEVLYQMGRFEEALVFYHMGGKQRPDMELFQQGVRKAQEAIEVSLGVKPPSIQQQLQQRTKKKAARIPPLNLNRSQHRTGGFAQQRDSSQLLGELHVDKLYLEKLIQNPGLHNPILPSQKIIHHARETLDYLRARENFWRQQQPANLFYLPPVEKPKLKTKKKKRRAASTTPTTTSFGASSDGSGTEREQRETTSSASQSDEEHRQSKLSNVDSEPDSKDNPPTIRRSSSEEVHRILAGSNGLLPEEDFIDELKQAAQDMIECYRNQQWNRIVHIYLTQCWRGPSGVEDLTEEIEGKLGQLKLLEEQRIQEALRPDDNSNSLCEMMQLTIDIAMLYLANGEEDSARKLAQRGARLADQANDKCGLIQVNLLMASLAALASDGPEISVHLARAKQTCSLLDESSKTELSKEESNDQDHENVKDSTTEKSDKDEDDGDANYPETSVKNIDSSDTSYDDEEEEQEELNKQEEQEEQEDQEDEEECEEEDYDQENESHQNAGELVSLTFTEEDEVEYEEDIVQEYKDYRVHEPGIEEEDEEDCSYYDNSSVGNNTLFDDPDIYQIQSPRQQDDN